SHGLEPVGIQCNISVNAKRGTLRGLHYQAPPAEEAKLVSCVRGRLFDVAVDLRPDSPAFRQWLGVELDAAEGLALYIPRGCAHGFLALADDTAVYYHMGAEDAPGLARGVRLNAPVFAIPWAFAPLHPLRRDFRASPHQRRRRRLPGFRAVTRVLVTGAGGYIGRQTLEPLARLGFEVHGLARRPLAETGVHWHALDMFDTAGLSAALETIRPTHLLHLAWTTEHGKFWTDPANEAWHATTLDLVDRFI